MHGSVPLVRSVANAISHQSSKIPHLRFHIVHRQSRAYQVRHDAPQVPSQRRRQSSVAVNTFLDKPADRNEPNDEVFRQQHARSGVKEEEVQMLAASHASDTSNVNRSMNMFDILEEGLPDKILSGLLSDSIGSPFIRQADNEVFNQALLALKPEYFLEPFKDLSRHLKGHRGKNALKVKNFDERASSFAAYLDWIVGLRRGSGNKLDLEACDHLLKCAGSMGDGQLAKTVLKNIMPDDGIEASLESYNYYSQALVWSHAFSSTENYNLRVIPRHLEIRASKRPPEALSGHVASGTTKRYMGIREEILNVFRECLGKGYSADEFTFVNVMTAMSREGDIDGVKSILKSVWNIDVDLLGAYDEEEIESPTFYEEGHHLHPSERLLFALAHCFGSNNDLRTAWLLVDFVSRNYNIQITKNVWLHLCEWAFVLSLRRGKAAREQGRDLGQISQDTFVQMVEAMSDEPHGIKPDATVHYLLSRSWRDRKHLDNSVIHLRELKQILHRQHDEIEQVVKEIISVTRELAESRQASGFATESFYKLRRRYMTGFFDFQRTFQFTKVAVCRIISETNWPGSGKLTDWERRKVSKIVEEFTEFLPNVVTYETRTGTVQLGVKHARIGKYLRTFNLPYQSLPKVLSAMDTDDQAKLFRRMSILYSVMVQKPQLDQKGQRDELVVVDRKISRKDAPLAFGAEAEKDLADPVLPFQ